MSDLDGTIIVSPACGQFRASEALLIAINSQSNDELPYKEKAIRSGLPAKELLTTYAVALLASKSVIGFFHLPNVS
jgi:hypothetical protein